MYASGEYQGAWEQIQRAHDRDRDSLLVQVHLLAAEGQLGKLRNAATTLSKINDLRRNRGLPPYSLWHARETIPYKNQTDLARFIDGLKKAKVPYR